MSKLTQFGQSILDAILDHATPVVGMGFIGWSIGKEPEITKWLAAKLGKPVKSIAGGIADLVNKGYLVSTGVEDETEKNCVIPPLGVTHAGWQAYTRWNPKEVTEIREFDLESWLGWDGIDGMNFPFYYDLPDWRVRHLARCFPGQVHGS